MKNQLANNQQDRIDLNKTIRETAIGRDLVEAAKNLLADQAGFFDGVSRFELIAARRISASYRVQITGNKGELWEAWEFELFTHSESL